MTLIVSTSTASLDNVTCSASSAVPLLRKAFSTSDLSAMTSTTEPLSVVTDAGSINCSSSSSNLSDDDDDNSVIDPQTHQLLEQHMMSWRQQQQQNRSQSCRSCLATSESSRRNLRASLTSSNSSSVNFSTIHIREYERIPGDHPETSMGVPLSIGWAFCEQRQQSVAAFEKRKMDAFLEDDSAIVLKPRKATGGCGGASGNVRRLGAMTRKRLLMDEFNVPLHEICQAEKAVQKFKKQLRRQRQAEAQGLLLEDEYQQCEIQPDRPSRKKSVVRSLRKGVMNKLSLRSKRNKNDKVAVVE